MSRRAKRSKSLEVEPIDADRVKFVLTLEDKGHSSEGEEIIHSLQITGTVAVPSLEILTIEPRAVRHPYSQCAASLEPVREMVGTRIGPGFRARVIELMGRTKGCTFHEPRDGSRCRAHADDVLAHAREGAVRGPQSSRRRVDAGRLRD
jgi:DUF2889 family protein